MNDRIWELFKQSGIDIGEDQESNIEKFAELIVKECVSIIQKDVSLRYINGGETEEFMGGHYAGSLLARVKIKQHFGVKE
jgi:hypothetical protein